MTTYVRRAFGDRAVHRGGLSVLLHHPLRRADGGGVPQPTTSPTRWGGGRGTALAVTALILVTVTAVNWFGIEASARTQLVIAAVAAYAAGPW